MCSSDLHDLYFVHISMFNRGLQKEWREWRADFTKYMKRLRISADRCHVLGQGSRYCGSAGPCACCVHNIADSFAVVASIWHTVEVTRIVSWAAVGFDLLAALSLSHASRSMRLSWASTCWLGWQPFCSHVKDSRPCASAGHRRSGPCEKKAVLRR